MRVGDKLYCIKDLDCKDQPFVSRIGDCVTITNFIIVNKYGTGRRAVKFPNYDDKIILVRIKNKSNASTLVRVNKEDIRGVRTRDTISYINNHFESKLNRVKRVIDEFKSR